MKLFKGLWKHRTTPLNTTYDTYNREVLQIITPNLLTGIRVEISKSILPYFQISNIKTKTAAQTFLTLSTRNTVFQFSFDSNRNYQFKSSLLTGPIVSKFHSIVSNRKDVFNHFESAITTKFHNLTLKLISPTFNAANLIYIVTYFTSLGFLNCGFEVVGQNNEFGLSFSTRIEDKNGVYCANIQKFNTIVLSFYRKLLGFIEFGGEVTKTSDNLSYAAGVRLKNYRSDVKFSVDTNRNIYLDWTESLTENLRIEFSSSYDGEEFEYGVGLTFEG